MDVLIKSLTPLFFLFFEKLCSEKVPYWFKIYYINLCIASLLYHYSIEYNISSEYKYIFEIYDRVSISISCYYRIFKDELYALLFGILSIFIEYNKQFSYFIAYIIVIFEMNTIYNISIFLILCISFYIFYTREDGKWTINQKIIWHFTQSFYIYLSTIFYN